MKLTPKEQEVLQLLAAGLSSREIAEKMQISFHTVESHRKNLRLKFDARNSVEILNKAYTVLPVSSSQIEKAPVQVV